MYDSKFEKMEAKDLIEKFEVLDYIYQNSRGNRQIISYIYDAMGKEKFESMIRHFCDEYGLDFDKLTWGDNY